MIKAPNLAEPHAPKWSVTWYVSARQFETLTRRLDPTELKQASDVSGRHALLWTLDARMILVLPHEDGQ